MQGIRLTNPQEADDGFTENNFVYNNTIINSENGTEVVRSHDNTLESSTLTNIQSSDDHLSGDSSIIMREQHFDNALISQGGSGVAVM